MNSVQESQMGTQFKWILLLAGLLLTAGTDSSWGQDEVPLQAAGQPGDDVAKPAESVAPIDAKETEGLAWYMKGVEAQENNDPEAALKAFEKATEADPSAPAPIRARAMLLLQSGEVRKGLELAREAIKLDPGDFRTRFQLATILLRKPEINTIREAIELMNQAVESDRLKPTDSEYLLIHSVRGRILLQLNQKAEAASSYEVLLQALERPEDFDLDFRRHKALMDDRLTGYEAVGEAMLSVGRTDEAVRAFEALVLTRGDTPGRHHLLLAMARFRSDDIEKSEASLDAYFASGRREKEALELLTQIYSSTSRSSLLIPKLQELRTDTPDVTVVVLYLAETQLLQGQFDNAAATFESVIVESGDPAGYPGLIRIDIVRADADSLINTLQKALRARVQLREIQPSLPEIINDQEFAQAVVTACLTALEKDVSLFPEVTWICANIAQEIKATEEEVGKLLQATLDRNPNQEIGQDALQQLGMHHLMNNRFAEAADLFRRLLSLRSLSTESRVLTLRNLAIAEAYNERIEQALDAIQTALSMFPKNAELLYRLGWIHFQNDNMSAAETALKSAIQKGANAPDIQNNARLLLAAVYSGAKKWQECISQYEEIIASPGQDEDITRRARLSLSAVYVEQGENATAEMILEELLVQMPDDPGVNNDLGYLYAEQDKNLDQALKMIEIAVAAEPDNQAYLDSLGWVLYRLKRHEEALAALLKANSDPGFQDATLQEHLGDVYEALEQHDEAISAWQKALATEQQSDTPKETVVKRLKLRLNPVETETEDIPQAKAPATP